MRMSRRRLSMSAVAIVLAVAVAGMALWLARRDAGPLPEGMAPAANAPRGDAAAPAADPRAGDAPPTLNRRDAFLARVRASDTWPLPAGNRIAGVTETRLADSPEAWLATLPLEDQPVAAAFLQRYAGAYGFQSREELAWMIEAGFPALEEVVAMRRMGSEARECIQPGRRCASTKLATLIADAGVEALQALEADPAADEGDKARARILIAGGLGAYPADPAAPRAPVLFALQVQAAAAPLMGSPEEAGVALALARVCGDYRMPDPPPELQSAVRMLSPGGSPGMICGAHLGFIP
jgi:hypothetical protein